MSVIDQWKQQLLPYLEQPDRSELAAFLKKESRLPSPQSNLSLAEAFCQLVHDQSIPIELFQPWLAISADDDTPEFYLAFCAIRAVGTCFFTQSKPWMEDELFQKATDARWRMREGIAMAYQSIGEQNIDVCMRLMDQLMSGADPLRMRCVIATLAHPPILKNHKEIAIRALSYADDILTQL